MNSNKYLNAQAYALSFPFEEYSVRMMEYIMFDDLSLSSKTNYPVTLSQPQAQRLKGLVGSWITVLENIASDIKPEIEASYQLADKANQTEESKAAFESLNSLRNYQRKLRKEINNLAEIQKVLKGLSK